MTKNVSLERNTAETNINMELNLYGSGRATTLTSIPFLDHMLILMCRHGLMDLKVDASGDTDVDYHHLMEDMGIVFGKCLREALADKEGIERFGTATIPMDEALAQVVIDLSGRSYLVYRGLENSAYEYIKDLPVSLFEDFFRAVSVHGMINLHINVHYGKDTHHIMEAIFKAFGRALRDAVKRNDRVTGIPSTKGVIE